MLETHHGCTDALLDQLVHGRDDGTAEAVARTRGRQVSVPDVTADALLSDDSRRPLLATGARALQRIPVLSSAGACTALITVHWPDAGHLPTPAQAKAFGLLASDTAAWLARYHRSILLDALEHLHRRLTHAAH
ncbi:hypothetical protein ABZ478_34495 [Streptomyces sp. NPDC005706]|uniref:hypothetical protein n=1 Tax=Streptomyces sp. NPDC005706 TaxID=3157169 RepID=UPI0033C303FD